MADSKVSALTAITGIAGEDLLYVVDDPSGTPLSRKVTVQNLVLVRAPQSISGATTLDIMDGVVVATAGSAYTVTLPSCSTNSGAMYVIMRDGANTITIDSGTDTYSDTGTATDRTLNEDGASIALCSVGGTEWKVLDTVGDVT